MPALIQHPGYSESELRRVEEKLVCRESQVSMLLSIFGEYCVFLSVLVLLCGHAATSLVCISLSLSLSLQLPHALLNCVECFTSRLLFEHILNQLCAHSPSPDNEFSSHTRCDSFNDFIRLYRQLADLQQQKSTTYIVLDRAEALRDMDANLLSGFLRLQELVGGNVTVIFLSEIVWEKFRPNTGCFEPLIICFPDYSKAELQQILSLDHHPEYSADLRHLLSELYSSAGYNVSLDSSAVCNVSVPPWCVSAKESDTHRLWRNIEPHLKKAMQTVYLREISSSQWEEMQQKEGELHLKGLSAHAHVELPYYSKFLLIAAYLASFNPARADKRFFLKHHGKIKKTNFLKKHEKTSNHLLGPKPFPLDRLLAIFYSIVDSRVAPTANIFSQISSLVVLQLLALVGHDDQLNSPKYKCAVSFDFIRAIAR
ncbi:origin recognition complex subunit 5 isoform X1 [Huso huso]|uniref:Origin recognition complex subunit 5 isoform X1 n=1 Tax=Huso huso TaxID=61971 RepID=A0ABR0ZU64_HUSHU